MVKAAARTEGVPPTRGETSTRGIQIICPEHGRITKSKKHFRIISYCLLQYMYSTLLSYQCHTSNPFCFSIPAAISVLHLLLTLFTFSLLISVDSLEQIMSQLVQLLRNIKCQNHTVEKGDGMSFGTRTSFQWQGKGQGVDSR